MYENLCSRFQIIEQEIKELMFDICSIVVNTSCRRKHVSVLGRKRLFCSFRAGLKLCSPTSASQVAGTTGPTEFLVMILKLIHQRKC